METAIVSVICIALILVGGMTMSQGLLTSADSAMTGVEELAVRDGEIARTDLVIVGATSLFQTDHLRVRLRNSGQTKLASFSRWDVIVQYYDDGGGYQVKWLPYVDGTLGDNEWKKMEIYVEAGGNILSDTFDPGILNPGEEMLVDARLSPAPQQGTSMEVVISTPNGVLESASLTAGETILTAHSETRAIAGSGYYALKEGTPADGTAMTETTDAFAQGETGSKIMHSESDASRSARHVFPLLGLAEIPKSTWTVYYRARTWGDPSFPVDVGDAELSVDILIRQADGTIRRTIATRAARAYITTPETWETISGDYIFTKYTVEDETDYLEIVYYGMSRGQGPDQGNAYIQLRVDDDSLAQADQTRVNT